MTDGSGSPTNLSAMKLALMAQQAREQFGADRASRADRHHRDGLSFSRRRRYARALLAAAQRGRRCRERDFTGSVGSRARHSTPIPRRPGKSSIRQCGSPRPYRPVRRRASSASCRREAERMDPQQRLFLEVAIDALDDAGLPREQLAGTRTGVFVASYYNDYASCSTPTATRSTPRTLTGTLHSVLANRLSYLLDLRGPEPLGRHGLFVLARRRPPRLPEPARRATATSRSPAACR